MTNPIKRFFEIIKTIVLFPISFLQMRRTYQEFGRMQRLPRDPEDIKRLLKEMGLEEEMMPLFTPLMPPHRSIPHSQTNLVDVSYMDDMEEDNQEENEFLDEES